MLEVKGIGVFYGEVQVLWEISLKVGEGEIVSIVGSNAAGKTTTLNTISGILRPTSGEIFFEGIRLDRETPDRIVERGLVQIPEGRRLFPEMTVLENLEIGTYPQRARGKRDQTLKKILDLFPILSDRKKQLASSLSGGQQQMLAIGRGLMAQPRLLMLDEPSLGLAPLIVKKTFEIIKDIRSQGTTILLVEQNVMHSLQIADRGYVLENGRIVLENTGKALLEDKNLKKAYLGN
ncbi:MAG: ABC transporter ATP-binding protein [Smithellaceae bacterium]